MIEVLEQTGSTNVDLIARLAAKERIPEGHWLLAKRQTSGRGRQGREWFDGAGNFMGSTIVTTSAQNPPVHTLALVSGLAVYEAVSALLPDPSLLNLKWPNDVMLGGVKLAGILLETSGDFVVVGIGVNLKAAPQLPDRQTTALAHVMPPPELDDFAQRLAKCFDVELERWRNFGLEALIRRWLSCAYPVGTSISVHDPSGETLLGKFDGLDKSGSLLLLKADGTRQVIHAGDIVVTSGD